MPTASLVHGRGRPSSASAATSGGRNTRGGGQGGYVYSGVMSQATSTGWKHAGLTPGWKSTPSTDPGDPTSSVFARTTNAVRFSHVQSSGYARVRPAITAADIHAELNAAREELYYHATVVEQANQRITVLEETHQSTTREFHEKAAALEEGIADTFTRLDETRIAAQNRRVDVDVARMRLEGLRAEVAKLEGDKNAELNAIATARDDFNVRAEELAAIELQFEGRNKRLVDAVDTEKLKQEDLMRQLVRVRTELEEAVERQRALKNLAAHAAAGQAAAAAAAAAEMKAGMRAGGNEARATITAGTSGQVAAVLGGGRVGTPADDDAPAPEEASASAFAADTAYVIHPDMPMPPPGRRRTAYFKSKAGTLAAVPSDLDDDDQGGSAFGWLGVDDLILVSGGGNRKRNRNGDGGGASGRVELTPGASGPPVAAGGGLLVGSELETARAVHDNVAAVLSGSKNEELHLWDIFQHYCTVGMQSVRKPTDRGMSMSMAQFSRFIAECVERARSAASRIGASAIYSETQLAAYNSLVDIHSADVDLLFTGILAQEQRRRRRRSPDLRARQQAAATAAAEAEAEAAGSGAAGGGFGGGFGGGGLGIDWEDYYSGGCSTSPRDAMAEFEQFLSGVVRLAARIRLPHVPESALKVSVEDACGGGGSTAADSTSASFTTGLGPKVDENHDHNHNHDGYIRLASGATLHSGLPHVVSGFLRLLVFPFARTAGEELARTEEVVRRAPPPRPTLRGRGGGKGTGARTVAAAAVAAAARLLSEDESDDDDY